MKTTGPGLESVRTLGELFLRSERQHDRPFALRSWQGDKPDLVPDWRLHRQILRIAIYLRERASVGPGDRVAVLAPLGPRSLVIEWGAILLGATSALLRPDLAVSPLLEALAPRFVFDEPELWSRATDLGGTLDTAERAQSIRSGARSIDPGAPALMYLEGTNGSTAWATLSHADALRRIRDIWSSATRPREVMVPSPHEGDLAARLALHAYVGDGETRIAFPAPADDPKGRRDTANEQPDRRAGA
jgi:acyl-CoA synthetase (AMP-forming)/AMP-acid ligase II